MDRSAGYCRHDVPSFRKDLVVATPEEVADRTSGSDRRLDCEAVARSVFGLGMWWPVTQGSAADQHCHGIPRLLTGARGLGAVNSTRKTCSPPGSVTVWLLAGRIRISAWLKTACMARWYAALAIFAA
jgi:hypothetical protein